MAIYLVAYGHVVRCERADGPSEAMTLAYGTMDPRRMTLVRLDRMPRNMNHKDRVAVEAKLAHRHFHRTGSILSGHDGDPGIKDYHWTECQLCHKPITTQPAEAGVDNACCQDCELKLGNLTKEEYDNLSAASMRTRLGISLWSSPALG